MTRLSQEVKPMNYLQICYLTAENKRILDNKKAAAPPSYYPNPLLVNALNLRINHITQTQTSGKIDRI